MNAIPSPNEQPNNEERPGRNLEGTDQQPNQEALDDPIKQEQYRRAYLRQLRLRSCPGCGETNLACQMTGFKCHSATDSTPQPRGMQGTRRRPGLPLGSPTDPVDDTARVRSGNAIAASAPYAWIGSVRPIEAQAGIHYLTKDTPTWEANAKSEWGLRAPGRVVINLTA